MYANAKGLHFRFLLEVVGVVVEKKRKSALDLLFYFKNI